MARKKKPEPAVELTDEQEADLSHLDNPVDVPEEAAPETPPEQETEEAVETLPEKKPEAKPELPKPKHPPGLRRRALAYGATAEQIDATSLEDLDAWVEEQNSLREDTPKPQPKPEAKKEAEEINWGTDTNGEPLKEADITPGIAKNIRALHQKQKALEATIKSADERDKQRQQRAIAEACDVAIEAMGPKYEKVFGKGDMRDLPKNSKEARRRRAAFGESGIDLELDSPAAIMRKLKKTANEMFEDLLEAPAKAPKEEDDEPTNGNGKHFTREEWNRGTTQLPSSRKAKEADQEVKFTQALRGWLRENVKEQTEQEMFEGLPD